jgi:Tfp pilus assembly protein PilF
MRRWTLITVSLAALVSLIVVFIGHQDNDRSAAPATAGIELAPPPADSTRAQVPPGTAALPPRTWEGGAWAAGVRAFQARDYETARQALEQAVQERDDISYRHYLLGLTDLRVDRPDLAATQLEVALTLSPVNVRTLVNLARARLALAQPEQARTAIQSALEHDATDPDAWLVLGRVELTQTHLDEAAAAFAKAAELDPNQAFAWNNLGYARIQQERFADAVGPLRTATQLRDDVAVFFNNLGVALERVDDLAGAHVAFQRAADLGHELARASLLRVDTVLVARGIPVPLDTAIAAAPAAPDSSATTALQDSAATSQELARSIKK